MKKKAIKKFIQITKNSGTKNIYINEPLRKNNQSQKLKITTWNVNGIRSIIKKKSFQTYIEKNNFDIICLNETRIDLEKLKLSKINENPLFYKKYNQYWVFSEEKKGYSGCCIFSKKNL